MKLYFIALLPDAVIQDQVTVFKQTALERFGAGHALKSPPHVTLIPPFRSDRPDFPALHRFAVEQRPFVVQLRNFNVFDNRVIFVDVVPNPDLVNCQARLAGFCRDELSIALDPRPFHPHMTVAFKDLTGAKFPEAWAYFATQPYERTFSANALTLLVHTGQRWIVEQDFSFG